MLELNELEIRIKPGAAVKSEVDEFYQRHGSQGTARPDDTFFLAYRNNKLLGCVRFCIEENTAMLRTMMIDENCRRQKIGLKLLQHFENYLIQNNIKDTYCIPYSHLEDFYGTIGFKTITDQEMPDFLLERINHYRTKGKTFACMKRSQ